MYSRSADPDIPPIITPSLFKYNKRSINTIKLDRSLGKGGYGTVYLCYDENKQELAVKCIKNKDFGIPSLIEASIMSVIQHPNLTKALKIHSTSEKLYIIQELAISDLRIYRQNNIIPNDIIIRWIHMIGQGLQCLHRNNLIHGDIKSSNVLVYQDNTVKISDFTLSTDIKWKNSFRPCTPTHRPLEVWLGEKWDYSVDIWSFGCTIYEIVHGKVLFVNQNRDPSINAIIDWNSYLPSQYKSNVNISYRDIFHYSFTLPDSFDTSNSLNKLILSLLIVLPVGRPNIDTILNNNLFSGFSVTPYMSISTPINSLLPKTEAKIRKILSTILPGVTTGTTTAGTATIELAYDLYIRLTGMLNANDKLKISTCAWIAHKMVERENISIDLLPFDLHEILQMERMICNYLSYRLYCKSTQIKVIQ